MASRKEIAVLVAAQAAGRFPQDEVYLPVQAGAILASPIPSMIPDNVGVHISEKNRTYCELTVVYWAWKNLEAGYVGLNHYRRYFSRKQFDKKWRRIADKETLEKSLTKAPVILPIRRNYYIETNYSQYIHAHHQQDLDLTRQIIKEKYPNYLSNFDTVMDKTYGHRFNMFVMRWDYFDCYCTWLFSILFELEKRLDISEYSSYDQRVFGFVAERLMDVWIETERVPYTELPVVFTDKQNLLKKGSTFLLRKLRGGKGSS